MVIRLISGSAAAQLLADPDFITRWGALARLDPKQTALQEPPFVSTWYSVYRQRYQPLLCLGHDDAGELAGVMPLAQDHEGGLVHAGAHQAEYHGWVCHPSIEGRFPAACLLRLQRELDLDSWAWRWLPPGAPVAWLRSPELASSGIAARVQEEQDSPLWDLQDERRLKKLLKNKSLKIKRNRYRKSTGLRLERITDRRQAEAVFPALVDQCDFRQGAVHSVRPFADDQRKLTFYLDRLASAEASHFTVLWAGDRPVASNFGACSDDALLVGLSTFDPTEGRNSPGMLLMLELAQRAREEGFRYIDLTPGGDAYKDKFANARRRLIMPTFHFTRTGRLVADLRRGLRRRVKATVLAAVGQPGLERAQQRVGQLEAALAGVRAGEVRALYHRREQLVYRVPAPPRDTGEVLAEEQGPPLRTQRYQELLRQTEALSPGAYQPLLSEALRRLSAGDVLYTATHDGRLVFSGWRGAPRKRHTLWTGGPVLETEEKSALIYDLRPEGAVAPSQHRGWLAQMIADAAPAAAILVSLAAEDAVGRAALEGQAMLEQRLSVASILGG